MESPTPQIERHLSANTNLSKGQVMLYNFLGGMSWGFGSVVGATVVIAIIGYILSTLGFFHSIGAFFDQLNQLKNQALPPMPQGYR